MNATHDPLAVRPMLADIEAHLVALQAMSLGTPEARQQALQEMTRLSGAVVLVRERLRRMAPDRPPAR